MSKNRAQCDCGRNVDMEGRQIHYPPCSMAPKRRAAAQARDGRAFKPLLLKGLPSADRQYDARGFNGKRK